MGVAFFSGAQNSDLVYVSVPVGSPRSDRGDSKADWISVLLPDKSPFWTLG